MLEVDARLPEPVILDLVKRASKHSSFVGIVINAQFISNRVSENEWKNDFIIPPYLKSANLRQYKDQYGSSDDLRDGYGLLSAKSRNGKKFSLEDI